MKPCVNCHSSLADTATVCVVCGAVQPVQSNSETVQSVSAPEQSHVDSEPNTLTTSSAMLPCRGCGEPVDPNWTQCPRCGTPVGRTNLKPGAGWWFLGFFVPIVGLILYLVWNKTEHAKARRVGFGALFGAIALVLITILGFVLMFLILRSVPGWTVPGVDMNGSFASSSIEESGVSPWDSSSSLTENDDGSFTYSQPIESGDETLIESGVAENGEDLFRVFHLPEDITSETKYVFTQECPGILSESEISSGTCTPASDRVIKLTLSRDGMIDETIDALPPFVIRLYLDDRLYAAADCNFKSMTTTLSYSGWDEAEAENGGETILWSERQAESSDDTVSQAGSESQASNFDDVFTDEPDWAPGHDDDGGSVV